MINLRYRVFIDDTDISNTQAAVLDCFISSQTCFENAEIVKASQKTGFYNWSNVDHRVAKRLNFILESLSYVPDTYSVFFPAHTIPSEPFEFDEFDEAISTKSFLSTVKLDLFMVNNGHPDIQYFNVFCDQNKDYSQISDYSNFVVDKNARWISKSGICSAYVQTQRPWYRAGRPFQDQWLNWVTKAANEGFLKEGDMQQDLKKQDVRPSMRLHFGRIFHGLPPQSDINYIADRYYVFPENRLLPEQYKLLHSGFLQKRLEKYYGSKSNIKKIVRHLLKKFIWTAIKKLLSRNKFFIMSCLSHIKGKILDR